ncbi:hypothetical protein [Salinarimonas soli]|uniref:Uncharacterized protein n=1 Tax=Salinarimonas soli TaxID=1638099 RepID=A0A5B2VDD2_9HYPH|nr:hypothetical protein [Salinarimonas soli]KAA2236954.1 hypothetical protein F0L46_11825 [Salinarimonas soli]
MTSSPITQSLADKALEAIKVLTEVHASLNKQQADRAALAYPNAADVSDLQARKEELERIIDGVLSLKKPVSKDAK